MKFLFCKVRNDGSGISGYGKYGYKDIPGGKAGKPYKGDEFFKKNPETNKYEKIKIAAEKDLALKKIKGKIREEEINKEFRKLPSDEQMGWNNAPKMNGAVVNPLIVKKLAKIENPEDQKLLEAYKLLEDKDLNGSGVISKEEYISPNIREKDESGNYIKDATGEFVIKKDETEGYVRVLDKNNKPVQDEKENYLVSKEKNNYDNFIIPKKKGGILLNSNARFKKIKIEKQKDGMEIRKETDGNNFDHFVIYEADTLPHSTRGVFSRKYYTPLPPSIGPEAWHKGYIKLDKYTALDNKPNPGTIVKKE